MIRFLLLLAAAAPSFANPVTTVRELFTHYAAGDLQRAAALWQDDDSFIAAHRRRMSARCAQLVALDARVVTNDGGVAAVETAETFLLDSTRLEQTHSRFLLRHRDGEWQITSWESREAMLADRVAAAAPADRAAILAASPDLQTGALVRLLSRRAVVRVNEHRVADAADLLDAARAIAERLGDPAALAEAISARSVAARFADPPDAAYALTLGEEAVALAAASGDLDTLAVSLLRRARATETLTGSIEADSLRPILAMADRVGDARTLSHLATHVARSLNVRGSVREGVRYAELASRFAEEEGDAAARISAALVLGGAYTTTGGDGELALRHCRRAAAMAIESEFWSAAASSFLSIAQVQFAVGDTGAARRTLEESLQKIAPAPGVSQLHILRAEWRASEGAFAPAERDLQRALELFPGDATTRMDVDLVRARILYRQGRFEDVLALARRVDLTLNYDFAGIRRLEAASLRRLGRADEALRLIEEVAAEEESRRTASADPERLLFAWRRGEIEELWLTLLVEQGKLAQALDVSERLNASVLRAILANGGIGARDIASPADRRTEQTLADRVAALNRAVVAAADAKQAAALRARLTEARTDLLDFRQRAFAGSPATHIQHATGVDLDALPPRLDALTIVSYVPTEESTMIFVIGPKQSARRTISVRVAPIGADALNRKIARFAVLLNERNLRADALGAELYELLLKPVERQIHAAGLLCIVPAGDLWRVPFHALRTGGGAPLIERVPVFYAPSIGVLIAAEAQRQQRNAGERPAVLAFANPHVNAETASLYRAFDRSAPLGALPETETEVRAIGRIYGLRRSSIRIGSEAREAILKRDAPRYDVLHVATHGLVYDRAPMFSALLLSASPDEDGDDGLLEAREIARLDLNADLAVFSACETGKMSAGVIGFSWALLAAGCPTTVVSQWNAQSASTAALMIEFHRRLVAGASKPEALRRAQLMIRRDPRYRHLFYWAPFVIVGAP